MTLSKVAVLVSTARLSTGEAEALKIVSPSSLGNEYDLHTAEQEHP